MHEAQKASTTTHDIATHSHNNESSLTEIWHTKTAQAYAGGGAARIAQQHACGKLTARERIELLLDPGSFHETDLLVTAQHGGTLTDGVITGFGTIDGRRVALYAQDFTINGGSLGNAHAQKICKIMDMAARIGCPIIGLIDSGGARIQEGIGGLAGYGDIFKRNVRYSGVIPQISVILGPCAGGAAYSPALTDFIIATEKIAHLFITGPQVIQEVLGEVISKEELGGAHTHATKSGVVHAVAPDETSCIILVRTLFSYIPDNYRSLPPQTAPTPDATQKTVAIPTNMQQAYDIKTVIYALVDNADFLELQPLFAPNIVTGFARIDGRSVGIVANQPLAKAGCIDIDASCKAARFIHFCDNFGVPLVTLVDTPGFLPGIDQEHNGIIRHGAKLLHAYAQATVPKITMILRKAFGGAYIVMGSRHLGADFCFALPFAQIAVMGARGAAAILHGKSAAALANQEERTQFMHAQEKIYEEEFLNPNIAAQHGYIDAIIDIAEIATTIRRALAITEEKVEELPSKKHGNCPL